MVQFVMFGDSVAAGVGAPIGKGCVDDLQRLIASRSTRCLVETVNISRSGWTTQDVTHAILSCSIKLQECQFIGIYVGGDDLIQLAPKLVIKQNKLAQMMPVLIRQEQIKFNQMLHILRSRTTRPICVGTIYNPFPNSSLASAVISTFNEAVIYPTATKYGVRIAPVAEMFTGNQAYLINGYSTGMLQSPVRHGIRYPIHPNIIGHQVIAQAFASVCG